MSGRRAATTNVGKASKLKALQDIQEAKKAGGRGKQYEMPEEEDVYDVVDEAEYGKVVNSRREREDFVVDDDGLGYEDDGEEFVEQGKRRGREEDREETKKAKKISGLQSVDKKGMASIPSWLTGTVTAKKDVKKTKKPKESAAGGMSEDFLDSMVNSLSASSTKSKKASKNSSSKKPVSSIKTYSSKTSSSSFYHTPTHHGQDHEEDTHAYDSSDNHMADDGFNGSEDQNEALNDENETVSNEMQDDQPSKNAEEVKVPVKKSRFGSTKEVVASASIAAASLSAANKPNTITSVVKKANPLKMATPELVKMDTLVDNIGASEEDATTTSAAADTAGVQVNMNNAFTPSAGNIDPARWLGKDTETGDDYLDLFWMDASEQGGNVYLFGKVGVKNEAGKVVDYASCCVVVHNLMRSMFALPRALNKSAAAAASVNSSSTDAAEEVTRFSWTEVHKEVSSILVPKVIPKTAGNGFKCKVVKRKYAFDDMTIPRGESEYLKIVYPACYPAPALETYAGVANSFSHLIGAQTSPLEHFIIKRKLMGPQWIRIKKPTQTANNASWAKLELTVNDPKLVVKCVDQMPAPPVSVMTLQMKTVVNPKTHNHEIVSLAAAYHKDVNLDMATEEQPKNMSWSVAVRALGNSAGDHYPARLPHDLKQVLNSCKMSGVMAFPNERAMISWLLTRIGALDPDIINAHNLYGFDMDVLLTRAVELKIGVWSKIGRLRRFKAPIMKSKAGNFREGLIANAAIGRILTDTYLSARDLLKEESYSLSNLSKSYLKYPKERVDIDPMDVPAYFNTAQNLALLVNHMTTGASLVQRLLFKLQVLPLTKQLTNISGNLWASTAKGGDRAKRIEYLLLHEFHHLKYVCPDKQTWAMKEHAAMLAPPSSGPSSGGAPANPNKKGRGKPQYSGGLVLEPKKGLYETYILLLDFNSLYPSIIQEYNICFTTMDWAPFAARAAGAGAADMHDEDGDVENDLAEVEEESKGILPPLPEETASTGVVPRVIKTIIQRRVEVKKILKQEKDTGKRQTLDIRQKALKLTANSLYGCLGFANSRFYAKPIAALVTAKGRETLQRTVDLAQTQLNMEVIYGDTDSIMINTNSTDLAHVKELGNQVKKECNKLYKTLELEMDGIFKSMLLLKKKKYAALVVEEGKDGEVTYSKETKGLDLVRRDWCRLSKTLGQYVLDQVLSGESKEIVVTNIHEKLDEVAKQVRGNEILIDEFVVTKGLNKNIKDYPDAKSMPHLQVALAMMKEGKPVNTGDHIPYVICVDKTLEIQESSYSLRAHHPDEVGRSNGRFEVDVEWYLTQQILPPIARLCDPIEGTSTSLLAEHLGLDGSKFNRAANSFEDDARLCDYVPNSRKSDAERYQGAKSWVVPCMKCHTHNEFVGTSIKLNSSPEDKNNTKKSIAADLETVFKCKGCGSDNFGASSAASCFGYMSNLLTFKIREYKQTYYEGWLQCDDSTCGAKTQQVSVLGSKCLAVGCSGKCKPLYSDHQLYTQLTYFEQLFNVNKYNEKMGNKSETKSDQVKMLRLLHSQMEEEMKVSSYNWVTPSFWSAAFS